MRRKRYKLETSLRKLKLSSRKLDLISSFSLLALAILSLMFLTPTTSSSVNAEGEPLTEATKLKAETYVYSTLAISLSGGVNLNVTPTSEGSFTAGEANLSVTTNNTTGYAVYLRTSDNTSALKPANGAIEAEIGPIVGTMTMANFKDHLNTWGYAVKDAETTPNYQAIPSSADAAIITTSEVTASDNYELSFAAAISPTLPAGLYYNSVLVSVVANPIAVHTLSGITYMQEMSPYVCDYSDEGETKQLIDQRDGNMYWVAKLADGNCWMTQNLALNLGSNPNNGAFGTSGNNANVPYVAKLTPADSDVTEEWVPSYSTNDLLLDGGSHSNVGSRHSWNMGKVVLATPLMKNTCSNYGDSLSAKSTDNLGVVCAKSGFVDVSDTAKFSPGYVSSVTDWEGATPATNMVVSVHCTEWSGTGTDKICTAGTYDEHYLIGNYYQYGAAAAGTNKVVAQQEDATSSICPRGWKLPAAGRISAADITEGSGLTEADLNKPLDKDDSFYRLLRAYGYPDNLAYTTDSVKNSYTSLKHTIGQDELGAEPFYFGRTGFVGLGANSVLRSVGIRASNWSSRITNNSGAFNFYMANAIVYPTVIDGWAYGIPVRCIAR